MSKCEACLGTGLIEGTFCAFSDGKIKKTMQLMELKAADLAEKEAKVIAREEQNREAVKKIKEKQETGTQLSVSNFIQHLVKRMQAMWRGRESRYKRNIN